MDAVTLKNVSIYGSAEEVVDAWSETAWPRDTGLITITVGGLLRYIVSTLERDLPGSPAFALYDAAGNQIDVDNASDHEDGEVAVAVARAITCGIGGDHDAALDHLALALAELEDEQAGALIEYLVSIARQLRDNGPGWSDQTFTV